MSAATRRLVRAWTTMMGLSLALAVSADVHAPSRLSLGLMAVTGVVVLMKCRIILAAYLELEPHRGMSNGLSALIGLTLVIVVGSFAL